MHSTILRGGCQFPIRVLLVPSVAVLAMLVGSSICSSSSVAYGVAALPRMNEFYEHFNYEHTYRCRSNLQHFRDAGTGPHDILESLFLLSMANMMARPTGSILTLWNLRPQFILKQGIEMIRYGYSEGSPMPGMMWRTTLSIECHGHSMKDICRWDVVQFCKLGVDTTCCSPTPRLRTLHKMPQSFWKSIGEVMSRMISRYQGLGYHQGHQFYRSSIELEF